MKITNIAVIQNDEGYHVVNKTEGLVFGKVFDNKEDAIRLSDALAVSMVEESGGHLITNGVHTLSVVK